jgi:hypothetical protein
VVVDILAVLDLGLFWMGLAQIHINITTLNFEVPQSRI